MDYLLVMLAAAGVAAVFSLNKVYQIRAGGGAKEAIKKNIPMCIIAAVMFFIMNGFNLKLNLFTAMAALVMALLSFFSAIVYYRAYSKGSVSVFTMFQMQGGMLLPYIYGIFYGNKLSVFSVLGIILMIVALTATFYKTKTPPSRIFIIFCVLIFVINGGISITSYVYSNGKNAVGLFNYAVLYNLMGGIISLLAYVFIAQRNKAAIITDRKPNKEYIILAALITLTAVISGLSYYLQLIGAKNLPAVALYPMITGGVVVFTALAGRLFFKDRLTRRSIIGIIMTAIATMLFVF